MVVDDEALRRFAALAELELSAGEVARMRRDLERILEYVAKLDELDTRGVPPTAHAFELPTPFREDRSGHVIGVSEALRNAPVHDERQMIVPKVLE